MRVPLCFVDDGDGSKMVNSKVIQYAQKYTSNY